MTKVLVAYASKHGSTAEIAAALTPEVRRHGVEAACLPADEVHDLKEYDGVVIGSAVYMNDGTPPGNENWRNRRRKPSTSSPICG